MFREQGELNVTEIRILVGRKVQKKARIMSYDYVIGILGLREGVKCSYLIQ